MPEMATFISAPYQLKPLSQADFPACEQLSIRSDNFSWPGAIWKRSLQEDQCLGLYLDEVLLAVAAFGLVLDELSLLNIVVDKQQQGRGLGRQFLLAGLEWMQQFGAGRCVLEVRKSNATAIRLYEKLGFAVNGLRKNYYPLGEGREDAVLMSAELPLEYQLNK